MVIRLQCACGQILGIDTDLAGPRFACPRCGRWHTMPSLQRTGSSGPFRLAPLTTANTDEDRRVAWIPVIAAVLAALLICLALMWALLSQLPAGEGLGVGNGLGAGVGEGTGDGTGGDGPGTGTFGDGSGSGTSGQGTGAGMSGLKVPGSAPTQPASSAPTSPRSPDSRPTEPDAKLAEPVRLGFVNHPQPIIPSPPLPEPSTSSGSGRTGGSGGGGSGASNAGMNPGARGDASFTLVWSYSQGKQGHDMRGGPDVDLWVIDPLGQKLSTSRDGVALGPTPEGGQIDFDDLGGYGPGDGGGPERAFWPEGKAPKGTYTYGVRWFQGTGTAKYALRVYRGKTLETTKSGTLTPQSGAVQLGTITVE